MLPNVTIPSYLFVATSFLVINGISNAPGTQYTSMFSSFTSFLINVSLAPPNNLDVMNSLKRATTIATLISLPINFP